MCIRDSRQPHAKAESRMEEDQRKTDETEPEVAAHPGLAAAYAPDRHLLPCPQQPGKQHKCEGDNPVGQPGHGPAVCTLRRTTAVGNVDHGGDNQRCQTDDEPPSMCLINAQWLLSLFTHIRFVYFLPLEQAAKKFQRVHAMRRIVRASIHATRFLVAQAKIARSSFHLHAGDPSSRIRGIVQLNRERMHIDAVSYTHLDVYKRQRSNRCTSESEMPGPLPACRAAPLDRSACQIASP